MVWAILNEIEYLNLSGNNITTKGIKYLGVYLEDYNPYLKTLDLSCNNLVDKGVQDLSQSLRKRHVYLSDSNFYRLYYKVYLPLLSLNLSKVKMGDKGFWTLINVFREIQIKNSSADIEDYLVFMELDISKNYICDNSFKSFCTLIKKFPFLYSLNVSRN